MTNTLAMLLGGAAGVLLRMLLDRLRPAGDSALRWDALVVTIVGAFLLGSLTGLTLADAHMGGARTEMTIGMSSALFTYCLFSRFAVRLITGNDRSPTLLAAIVHTFSGFGAAIPGVLIAMWLVGW
jgi:fluoride ion exporter CrcB/FEX